MSIGGLPGTWKSAFWAGDLLQSFQRSYFITDNLNDFINFYVTGNKKTTYKSCSYKLRIIILEFLFTLQLKTTLIYQSSPKQ
jgi:hypothetical protein